LRPQGLATNDAEGFSDRPLHGRSTDARDGLGGEIRGEPVHTTKPWHRHRLAGRTDKDCDRQACHFCCAATNYDQLAMNSLIAISSGRGGFDFARV
jgi:hypothetical protein